MKPLRPFVFIAALASASCVHTGDLDPEPSAATSSAAFDEGVMRQYDALLERYRRAHPALPPAARRDARAQRDGGA